MGRDYVRMGRRECNRERAFRTPKKKEVRCIIEIRIPPSCLVIDTIRNKEME